MNLQICCPYKKCPFGCPTCIAATDYVYPYGDIYFSNREKYLDILRSTIGKYDTYVLTGDTEPTLFYDWIKDVVSVLKGQNIELQTKNYWVNIDKLEGITTLAISIPSYKDYQKYYPLRARLFSFPGKVRLVFLAIKELESSSIFCADPFLADEITVKELQLPEAKEEQENVIQMRGNKNKWIALLAPLQGMFSVRYDANCMEAAGRYEILRTDGKFYDKWF